MAAPAPLFEGYIVGSSDAAQEETAAAQWRV